MDLHIRLDLWIPMRDGVELYAALYRPAAGGPFPVLLHRSPYSTQHPRYVDWAVRFVDAGYAVVMQDGRGRYESQGRWRPYVDEAADGYDTQQWVGRQDWCDGTIGTFGISYPGFTQILPAPHRSAYVKALVPNRQPGGQLRPPALRRPAAAAERDELGVARRAHEPERPPGPDRLGGNLPAPAAADGPRRHRRAALLPRGSAPRALRRVLEVSHDEGEVRGGGRRRPISSPAGTTTCSTRASSASAAGRGRRGRRPAGA